MDKSSKIVRGTQNISKFHPKSSLEALLGSKSWVLLSTVWFGSSFVTPKRSQKWSNMPQKRTKTIQKGSKIGKTSSSEAHFSMTLFLLRVCSRFSMILMPSWQEKPWFLLAGATFSALFEKNRFLTQILTAFEPQNASKIDPGRPENPKSPILKSKNPILKSKNPVLKSSLGNYENPIQEVPRKSGPWEWQGSTPQVRGRPRLETPPKILWSLPARTQRDAISAKNCPRETRNKKQRKRSQQ